MTLLDEIQRDAVDSSSDLGELLRKCKILAVRLDSRALEEWIVKESSGYPQEAPVPDYRVLPLRVRGDFSGPYGSAVRNIEIPPLCIPETVRDKATIAHLRLSITAIQDLVNRRSESGSYTLALDNLPLILRGKVFSGMNCVRAWGEIAESNLVEVLTSVRNRILDFALAIWREAPGAGERSASEELPAREVSQIFNTTILGSVGIVGSATDSTISLEVKTNDFDALVRVLREAGVQDEDIAELRTALDEDPAPESRNALGPRVSGWIGKMVQKAASGAWDIAAGTAGAVLADIIGRYYGLR